MTPLSSLPGQPVRLQVLAGAAGAVLPKEVPAPVVGAAGVRAGVRRVHSGAQRLHLAHRGRSVSVHAAQEGVPSRPAPLRS